MWRYPLYPEIFTVLHNDPAVHQDHCERCRIRTPEVWRAAKEPPHLQIVLILVETLPSLRILMTHRHLVLLAL